MKYVRLGVKYIGFFILAYIFGCGELFGVRVSSLLCFSSAYYLGLNYYLISLLYLGATLLGKFSLWSFLQGFGVCIVFGGLMLKEKISKKKSDILAVGLTSLIATIPLCFIGVNFVGAVIGIIELIANELTTFLSLIFVNVIKGRRRLSTLSRMEKASFAVLLVCWGIASGSVELLEINLFWLFNAFALMLIAFTWDKSGLIATFLIGCGVALATIRLEYVLVCCLVFLLAALLARLPVYVGLIGVTALYSLSLYVFKESYMLLIPFSVGALAYALVPLSAKKHIRMVFCSGDGKLTSRNIVNRTRQELFVKLNNLSLALGDMSSSLRNEMQPLRSIRECKDDFAEELASKFCHNCKNYDSCASVLNSDTSVMLYKLVSASVEEGRIQRRDVPPYMLDHCNRLQSIISASEGIPNEYERAAEASGVIESSKLMLAEQLQGLAGVLKSLSENVLRVVTFDESLEKRLIEGLGYRDIVVSEAILYKDNNKRLYCSLVIRAEDESKDIIKAVSMILNVNMMLADSIIRQGATICVSLMSCPKYDVIFGEAWLGKNRDAHSGDTRTVSRLTPDKFLVGICDGMGKDNRAERTSELTISLIESFFRAGISDNTAVELINKLLMMRRSDTFSALDIAVVDMESGNMNCIKLGGVESFIARKSGIEIISGSSLPLGILDEIKPSVTTARLSAGDMLVLLSDGVTDALSSDGVVGILENTHEKNPESMANCIVKEAVKKGAKDDLSVICVKIVLKL